MPQTPDASLAAPVRRALRLLCDRPFFRHAHLEGMEPEDEGPRRERAALEQHELVIRIEVVDDPGGVAFPLKKTGPDLSSLERVVHDDRDRVARDLPVQEDLIEPDEDSISVIPQGLMDRTDVEGEELSRAFDHSEHLHDVACGGLVRNREAAMPAIRQRHEARAEVQRRDEQRVQDEDRLQSPPGYPAGLTARFVHLLHGGSLRVWKPRLIPRFQRNISWKTLKVNVSISCSLLSNLSYFDV